MSVLFGTENTKNIVVLVDWLAEVTSFLFIPPVGVGIPELAFHGWRVGVVSVLQPQQSALSETFFQRGFTNKMRVIILGLSSKGSELRKGSAGMGIAGGGLGQPPGNEASRKHLNSKN